MRSTIGWIYAVLAVLLVTLVIIAVWIAIKTGFFDNALSIIVGYLQLPF